MADLTITAANVTPGSGSATDSAAVAGETITQGMPCYIKASDGKAYKAKAAANVTGDEAKCKGIALNAALAGQPVTLQTKGQLNLGAILTAGKMYVVSRNFGGIAPIADLTTGDFLTELGHAISTSVLQMRIVITGTQN